MQGVKRRERKWDRNHTGTFCKCLSEILSRGNRECSPTVGNRSEEAGCSSSRESQKERGHRGIAEKDALDQGEGRKRQTFQAPQSPMGI